GRGAVAGGGGRLAARPERLEHRRSDVEAADDAGLRQEDARLADGILVDHRRAGHVAGADVLGQPGTDVDGRQLHRSSSTLSSFRITVFAAKRSSSKG